MSRVALLIRTHYVDERLRAFVDQAAADGRFDVYAVADETSEVLDFGDAPKISLTGETITELGLYDQAPKAFWRCGDYALYAARKALPQHDAFWMIEPDVRLRSERPCDVLARFPGPDQADLLAGRLRPAEADWDWGVTMQGEAGTIWRCLFAVVRLSARAIDLLYEERRALSVARIAMGADPKTWPNDEAFVATTLARHGMALHDLNAFGQVYDDIGFSYWFPVSERELETTGREGWIYHPVLSGQAYFLKLCRLAVRHGALDELERIVERMTGLEWTPAEARSHLRAIDFLKVQQEIGSAPAPLAAE
jgi:hypothetical protein